MPLTLVGPSGSGKGTLFHHLLDDFPHIFEACISFTTRKPRVGEIEGVHKYFISQEQYDEELKNGSFITIGCFFNQHYGTKRSMVDSITAKGKICLMESSIAGTTYLKESKVEINYLFIIPPPMDELKRRLIGRNQQDSNEIEYRLQEAQNDLDIVETLPYIKLKIVNNDFDTFYSEVKKNLRIIYPCFDFGKI